jgi:hypothetical protein
MKAFHFATVPPYIERFSVPIRDKTESLRVITHAIKMMTIEKRQNAPASSGGLTLIVDKMSRLFFWTPAKYYSVTFPFKAFESEEGGIEFESTNSVAITAQITSFLLMLLNTGKLFTQDEYEYLQMMDECHALGSGCWDMIRDLITCEDGYIRYDHDRSRMNGHFHPEFHLDVFYTQAATFKLGHDGACGADRFMDYLNTRTHCGYISLA